MRSFELYNLNNFVDEMQSTSGRIDKELILKKYQKDGFILSAIKFLLNPYIVTGISKKKVNKYVGHVFDSNSIYAYIDNMNSLFSYLKVNNTGRDVDLLTVEAFIRDNSDYRNLITSLVTKDLKLGVQATTINKVYGKNTIPTFDVMLAHKYFDDPEKYLPDGEEFIITQKLDGVRCVCVKDSDGGIKFFSRQGQPILDLVEIMEEAKHLPNGYVYDGELLLKNDDNLDSKDLYRATVKVTGSDNVKTNLVFNVFDMITIDGFKSGYDNHFAYLRKSTLNKVFARNKYNFIKEVPVLYRGKEQDKINYFLDKITSSGGEGIMINLSIGPYECKRSKNLLKVKKMQTADVLVLDVQEGTGQNQGKLGAILVKFIGPDNKEYTCYCGSGFTLEERKLFWKNRDLIVGKIVEVQYFEISQNESGQYSFRFPVFKYIRNDKSDISMY